MSEVKKFEIILEYIKDLSIETPSAEALRFVRENFTNYNMDIDISSSILQNKALEREGHSNRSIHLCDFVYMDCPHSETSIKKCIPLLNQFFIH